MREWRRERGGVCGWSGGWVYPHSHHTGRRWVQRLKEMKEMHGRAVPLQEWLDDLMIHRNLHCWSEVQPYNQL